MRAQETATVRSRFSASDPRFIALLILALALVIRLWDLTARSLWLDAWCREGGIYYGRWLRSMKPEEKAESVFETMNQVPNEFWFIMAHAQEHEQDSMGGMLREHFDFVDQMTKFDAAAVLLKRRAE